MRTIPSILLLLLLCALGSGLVHASDSATRAQRLAAAADQPNVRALRSDLARLVRTPSWEGDTWSVLAVSLANGDTLFAHAPDRALKPASNMKLFTAAAGLYYLGPDYRYSTFLLTDGRVEGGTVSGDLIVYGTGDPTISERYYDDDTTVWEAFADSLAAMGVGAIRGDVVGDGSYFEGFPIGLGWLEEDLATWYAAPAGALSFNDNMVTLRVLPADEVGWRPRVQLIPEAEGIAIVNQALTVAGGGTRIEADRAAYTGPLVVRGDIRAGHSSIWRSVPVADPARYAAAALYHVLEERGIVVAGGIGSIHRPEASPVTGRAAFAPAFTERTSLSVLEVRRSPPLLEILEFMVHESHNLYAEQVLRTVGRVAYGEGSVDAGEEAIEAMLERIAEPDDLELRVADGSGLSRLNRASAGTIVELLAAMARSPLWEEFWYTLPEAGRAGGLRRMYETAAALNLRAKTGTISHVSALSGYVRAANGELLAFSIISNGVPSTWRAKRIEDAIGARLATFTRPRPDQAETLAVDADEELRAEERAAARDAVAAQDEAVGPAYHTIRPGDTLEEIAQQYDTTIEALRRANPGIDPRRLMPGERVKLPD